MKISPSEIPSYKTRIITRIITNSITQFLKIHTIPQNREKIVEIIINEDISIDHHDF